MDPRLLAMVRKGLRLGVWLLGQAATDDGCLGPRTLGAQRRRLGLGPRSLAINGLLCANRICIASR